MIKSMASVFSPAMASQEKKSPPVESDDRECSDLAVNSDALPEDYPIHLEPEARRYYESSETPVPFLIGKRSPTEMVKKVVVPTKKGLRPKNEKATKIVKIVAKVRAPY